MYGDCSGVYPPVPCLTDGKPALAERRIDVLAALLHVQHLLAPPGGVMVGARQPQAAVEAGELYAAISALPGDFRDVLVAVDVAGLSYKEAARSLRIPEGTVMSRLFRGRKLLQKSLQQYAATAAGEAPVDLAQYRARKNLG